MKAGLVLIVLGIVIQAVSIIFTRAQPDEGLILLDAICPSDDPCLVEEFALSRFRQDEGLVTFDYWPGQVPCDTRTDPPFPCPAGGNTFNVPDASIQQGIAEWSTAPSPVDTAYNRLQSPPAGSACGGVFSGLDTLLRETDGRNTVMWAPLNGSVIGIACWWSGTNECDIILDNTWEGMASAENARTVLLHESGHCMGLSHSSVEGAVMEAVFDGPQHLAPDDIAGYCALYGCSSPPPATATPTSSSTPTSTPTRTPTATQTPTKTPVLYHCLERVWTTPVACARIPGVASDK